MPPREAQPAATDVPAAKPEEKKPVVAEAVAEKPAVVAAGAQKQVPVVAEKPAQPPVKPEPLKAGKVDAAEVKKPPVKHDVPAATKSPDAKVEKTAVAIKSPEKKPVAKAANTRQQGKPAEKKMAGAYTLRIGTYLFENNLKPVEAKLKKAGISSVQRHKIQKLEPMQRLFFAEFSDHDAAVEELEKLKKNAPDAFLLDENGKFVIYAGSYYRESKAAIEQDRLFDKGIKLVMKKVQVKVPVIVLTAGSFAGREQAQKSAAALKKSGIIAQIEKTGKK